MAESRWHRLSDAGAALYSTEIVVFGADQKRGLLYPDFTRVKLKVV
jgi:hypothetical protein